MTTEVDERVVDVRGETLLGNGPDLVETMRMMMGYGNGVIDECDE